MTATEDSWSLTGMPSVCPEEVKLGLGHCLGGDVKAAMGTVGEGLKAHLVMLECQAF